MYRDIIPTLVIMCIGISGCVSPLKYASLEDHRDMMDECRSMCGEDRVLRYRVRNGECICIKTKSEASILEVEGE